MLFWFPMMSFGLVTLGAAAYASIFDPAGLGFYWMVAGSLAGVATAWHYRRRELDMGLVSPTWPYVMAAALLGGGAFILPLVMDRDPAWAVSVWTGIGYGLFAFLERSTVVACVACSFVLLGLLFLALEVNLSQHLSVLEEAGLVTVDKTFEGKRVRTWVQATRDGRRAFRAEVEVLRSIIQRSDDADV